GNLAARAESLTLPYQHDSTRIAVSRTCPDCHNTYDDEILHCPEDGRGLSDIPAVDDLIGRTVGSYRVEKLLGKGGMGCVYMGVPLGVAGPMLLQVCDALEAAHKRGIVHRDLKPDNVYLITMKGKKNFVKVVDFGIARVTDDAGISTGKTQTGMVMGTPAYMSPEQGSGASNKIDGRSDVYSLGVMMFQLATGRLPFPGSNFGEVL